jgi:hypothetical protein
MLTDEKLERVRMRLRNAIDTGPPTADLLMLKSLWDDRCELVRILDQSDKEYNELVDVHKKLVKAHTHSGTTETGKPPGAAED